MFQVTFNNNIKGRMSVSSGSLMVWGCFFAHGRSPLVVVQGVEVLDWSSRSPDLNPIEHIWDELGRRVRQQVNPPQTLGDLERALVEHGGVHKRTEIHEKALCCC